MDVFQEESYRNILRAAFQKAKENNLWSLTSLSQALQVHPTFLSQVFKGRKDLSIDQAYQIAKAFEFTNLETDYFLLALQENRAGHHQTKAHFQKKMKEMRSEKLKLSQRLDGHKQLTDEEKAVFYSSWLYSMIRVLTSFEHGMSAEEIAERLDLPRDKVMEYLQFLCKVGLCREENEMFLIGEQHIHVPANSPFVVRHHINWRLRALHNLDQSSAEEMHFTSLMAISKKDFSQIREQIVKLIQEAVALAKESKPEDAICLTIDFFSPMKN